LYTSELLRAWQTVVIIQSSHPELEPIHSPLLLEVHSPYGGTPRSAMKNCAWDLYSSAPPGYEQPVDVLARARQFVAQARAAHVASTWSPSRTVA
jgi:hypothetical protein